MIAIVLFTSLPDDFVTKYEVKRILKVLIAHNHYGHFAIGGEGAVVHSEAELLRSKGHKVMVYERTNSEILEQHLFGRFRTICTINWSPTGYRDVGKILDEFKPDVMHVHNYKFLLSPSIFLAAKERGIATVHTLHNYRLACPAGQFLHKSQPCEACLDERALRILWRRCASRDHYLKNVFQLYIYFGNRRRGKLVPWVDAFIALSEFGRTKFVECGIPEDQIYVKPNFLRDPLERGELETRRRGGIFLGRLSPEKGVEDLIEAWRGIDYPLLIVGDGPERQRLQNAAPRTVQFLGSVPRQEALHLTSRAAFFVFPSLWYEGCPLSLVESMAVGCPSIASDLGPRREMIEDGVSGLLFEAGNVAQLREKCRAMIQDRQLALRMGRAARKRYLEDFAPDGSYRLLRYIYAKAIEHAGAQRQM